MSRQFIARNRENILAYMGTGLILGNYFDNNDYNSHFRDIYNYHDKFDYDDLSDYFDYQEKLSVYWRKEKAKHCLKYVIAWPIATPYYLCSK